MGRGLEEFLTVGDLHDAAQVHHGNSICQMLNHCQVMTDEQITQPLLLL
jgi:hypothetical protein